MTRAQTIAVLGFRPHTYWTAVVAVAGEADAPQVIERRRIVFASGDERSVFHQAAEAPPARASAATANSRCFIRISARGLSARNFLSAALGPATGQIWPASSRQSHAACVASL